MLFYTFISLIFSIKCIHSVDIESQPMQYTFNVDEGEYICINASNPFSAVVFHNSIIKAQYYLKARLVDQIETGDFLFPSEKGGISFGGKTGSVEVMALIPGNVSFSTFSFPPNCLGRLVTTKQSVDVSLYNYFGNFVKGHYCIWYPQSNYDVELSEDVQAPDSYSICQTKSNCKEPFSKTHLTETVTKPSYISILAHTIDIFKYFTTTLTSKSKKALIPFDIEGVVNASQPSLFTLKTPKKPENDKSKEKDEKKDKNDKNDKFDKNNEKDDDIEKDEEEEKEAPRRHYEIPPKHNRRNSSRKEISVFEIISLATVVFSVIIIIVMCFIHGGSNSICKRLLMHQGRQRVFDDTQSETRLLSQREEPAGSSGNFVQQMPLTGVYFPPVTSNDQAANQQQNMNNMQPQPILILPQNVQQQNLNNGQPQFMYPQYAFVQPPGGYQLPINQNQNQNNFSNTQQQPGNNN